MLTAPIRRLQPPIGTGHRHKADDAGNKHLKTDTSTSFSCTEIADRRACSIQSLVPTFNLTDICQPAQDPTCFAADAVGKGMSALVEADNGMKWMLGAWLKISWHIGYHETCDLSSRSTNILKVRRL